MQEDKTLGELFAGIGMFGLGLAAAGYRTVWQSEIEEFPTEILKLRFPDALQLGDIREIDDGVPKVDGLCGGFPCQDLSLAGRGAGLAGARSGLWGEYARVIGIVEPEIVYIENVTALLYRGMDQVVLDLCELGYSVEWDCLPAAYFGAPHLRDRVWIVAHREPDPYIFGDVAGLFPAPIVEQGEGDWRRWPRAGFTTRPDEILDLHPLAPMSAVKNGRARALWPQVGDREWIPTPCANEAGNSVVSHIAQKNYDGATTRVEITSLAVLARNGLQPATPEEIEEARRLGAELRPPDEEWRTPTAGPTAQGGGGGELQAQVNHGPSRRLLPTPMASDGERVNEQGPRYYDGGGDNPTLIGAAKQLDGVPSTAKPVEPRTAAVPEESTLEMWPTPNARDWKDSPESEGRLGRGQLPEAVRDRAMWPTPQAADGLGGRNEDAALARADDGSGEMPRTLERPSGAKAALTLSTAARAADRMWPTPKSSPSGPDFARAGRDGSGTDDLATAVARDDTERAGQLNPTWVEWLMGVPLHFTDPDVWTDDLEVHGWETEPDVPRITRHALHRRNRLTALGNALVRHAPAWIGQRAVSRSTRR